MVWNFIGGYVINRSLNDRLEKRNFSSCVEKCFARSLHWLVKHFSRREISYLLEAMHTFLYVKQLSLQTAFYLFLSVFLSVCLSVLYVWRGYQFTFTALLVIHKFVTRIAWTIVPRFRVVTLLQTVSVVAFTSTWKKCITSRFYLEQEFLFCQLISSPFYSSLPKYRKCFSTSQANSKFFKEDNVRQTRKYDNLVLNELEMVEFSTVKMLGNWRIECHLRFRNSLWRWSCVLAR